MPILPKRLNSGDGGIRTPRPFRITCFRDRLPARLAHIPISAAHRSRTCKPALPAHCLPDSSSTIEGLRRIVGRVGLEPTSPRATVLQTACFIRFAYLPILYERCERDLNPQSVFTDHRFSRPARYLLRHHSIVSGAGVEPASPKGHMNLSHARFPVSHPDKAYRRRDRTLKTLLLRQVRIPVPSLLHKCLWRDLNPQWYSRPGFLARRIFRFCYRDVFFLISQP